MDYRFVGKRIPKLDAKEKVTGSALYAGDMRLPGMVRVRLLQSPYAHATVRSIDTSAAEKLPGVCAIFTHLNIPAISYTSNKRDPIALKNPLRRDQELLSSHVRFAGEPVALVAAESAEAAAQALELIEVDYEAQPVVTDAEAALADGAPLVHPDFGSNLITTVRLARGDVQSGFGDADLIVENTFRTSRQKHCQMEPFSCLADCDKQGRLTVWTPTQSPHLLRVLLANMFQLPVSKVRVIVPHFGGGFGGRGGLVAEQYAAMVALRLRRPAHVQFDRTEDFVATESRHPMTVHVRAGAKSDGTITAWQVETVSNAGAYASNSVSVATTHGHAFMRLYRCPNLSYEGKVVYTTTQSSGSFRGLGGSQSYFAQEQILDEIARRISVDPVDYRQQIALGREESDPRTKLPLLSNGFEECLRLGTERIGWWERHLLPRAEGPWRRGFGMAAATWGSGTGCNSPDQREGSGATVRFNLDGSVDVRSGATDLGTGLTTTLTQIVAEELSMPLERINLILADTELTPFDSGAHASRSLFNAGNAVRLASDSARSQLLALAGRHLEADPLDLELHDGVVRVKGAPARSLPLGRLCQIANLEQTEITGKGIAPDSNALASAAHFVQLLVNIETGELQLERYVAAHDVGYAINPTVVEGQLEGSIAQGFGFALSEDLEIDPHTGSVLNASFMDYKVLTAADVAPIEVILVESPDANGPFGAKGVGEIGLPPVAPAIANAIFDAVGVRLHRLPMTPDRLMAELERCSVSG